MKRKLSLPSLLGILLILCSLLLTGVFQIRTRIAGEKVQTVSAQLEALLPERTPGLPGIYRDSEMPVLELGGEDYAALLEIPMLGVKLPVANQWDAHSRELLPSRYWGSVYAPPCVIGGHDIPGQFDFCGRIDLGTRILVTDTTGAQFVYTVSRVDRSKEADAQWLLGEGFELTLFCRSTYAMEYIAVRCTLQPSTVG